MLLEVSGVILDPDGGANPPVCNPNGAYVLPLTGFVVCTASNPFIYGCEWNIKITSGDPCFGGDKWYRLRVLYDETNDKSGIWFQYCQSPFAFLCSFNTAAIFQADSPGDYFCTQSDGGGVDPFTHPGRYDCKTFNNKALTFVGQDEFANAPADWSSASVSISAI